MNTNMNILNIIKFQVRIFHEGFIKKYSYSSVPNTWCWYWWSDFTTSKWAQGWEWRTPGLTALLPLTPQTEAGGVMFSDTANYSCGNATVQFHTYTKAVCVSSCMRKQLVWNDTFKNNLSSSNWTYIHSMYLTIQKNKLPIQATTWRDPKGIMLSENLKRLHTIWPHLYSTLKMTRLQRRRAVSDC